MGTNYYWCRRDEHIGKTSFPKSGPVWTWAEPPDAVITRCMEAPDSIVAVDEYGTHYTGDELLALIRVREQNHDFIGRDFS